MIESVPLDPSQVPASTPATGEQVAAEAATIAEGMLPRPIKDEAFAYGGLGTLPEATAVRKEAARLTEAEGSAVKFYPTPDSRATMKKLHQGGVLAEGERLVNRTNIAQARENIDKLKPQGNKS